MSAIAIVGRGISSSKVLLEKVMRKRMAVVAEGVRLVSSFILTFAVPVAR